MNSDPKIILTTPSSEQYLIKNKQREDLNQDEDELQASALRHIDTLAMEKIEQLNEQKLMRTQVQRRNSLSAVLHQSILGTSFAHHEYTSPFSYTLASKDPIEQIFAQFFALAESIVGHSSEEYYLASSANQEQYSLSHRLQLLEQVSQHAQKICELFASQITCFNARTKQVLRARDMHEDEPFEFSADDIALQNTLELALAVDDFPPTGKAAQERAEKTIVRNVVPTLERAQTVVERLLAGLFLYFENHNSLKMAISQYSQVRESRLAQSIALIIQELHQILTQDGAAELVRQYDVFAERQRLDLAQTLHEAHIPPPLEHAQVQVLPRLSAATAVAEGFGAHATVHFKAEHYLLGGEVESGRQLITPQSHREYAALVSNRNPRVTPIRIIGHKLQQQEQLKALLHTRNYFHPQCTRKFLHHFLENTRTLLLYPIEQLEHSYKNEPHAVSVHIPFLVAQHHKSVLTPNGELFYLTEDTLFQLDFETLELRTLRSFIPSYQYSLVYCAHALYLIGGYNEFAHAPSTAAYRYNLLSQSFERLADLLHGVQNAHTAVLDDRYIFRIGGLNAQLMVEESIERFDALHDTWQEVKRRPANYDLDAVRDTVVVQTESNTLKLFLARNADGLELSDVHELLLKRTTHAQGDKDLAPTVALSHIQQQNQQPYNASAHITLAPIYIYAEAEVLSAAIVHNDSIYLLRRSSAVSFYGRSDD